MTAPQNCDVCGEREAEFKLRKISQDPAVAPPLRFVCKLCLGRELENDTTSIVRITKSEENGSAEGSA